MTLPLLRSELLSRQRRHTWLPALRAVLWRQVSSSAEALQRAGLRSVLVANRGEIAVRSPVAGASSLLLCAR